MKKLLKIGISKQEWISFVLTLIATLIGVLIAIWLTNSGVRNKEKDDTVKLLHTAKIILSNTKEYTTSLNKTILEFQRDSINYSRETLKSIKKENPIPYPDLLETVISNELVSKNISEFTHNSIYNNLINIRKLDNYETTQYYLKSLDKMIINLDLEIELLKGNIEENELETKLELEKKAIENKYSTENILEVKTN